MDALAGVSVFATSGTLPEKVYQVPPAELGERRQQECHKTLSLVGYDRPDLLHAAIRENHVRISGRPLAKIASFGGHLAITVEAISALPPSLLPDEADRGLSHGSYKDVVQDVVSEAAYKFATKTFPGLKPLEDSIRNKLAGLLGEGIFDIKEDKDLFIKMHTLTHRQLAAVFEALKMPELDLKIKTKDLDNAVQYMLIPRFREVDKPRSRLAAVRLGEARLGDSLRDVEAGYRIQQVRSRATAALSDHYAATRLSREALQEAGDLPPSPATVDALPIVLLQGILDYLIDNKLLLESIASSVALSVGGRSPHRMRTICQDPDAEVAAIIRSKSGIVYAGCRFERFLCLVPLGSAMVVVATKYFQPSGNIEIEAMVESLKTMKFMDQQRRLMVGPGYSQIAGLIAKVSRSGMSFNVAKAYEYMAKTMAHSSHSAQDSGDWRELCHATMRTSQSYSNNSVMQRSVLDGTLSLLRKKMDEEADSQGLETAFTGRDPNEALKMISAVSEQPGISEVAVEADTHEDEPDELVEFMVHYIGGALHTRICPCTAQMNRFSDFCGQCKKFFPGTLVCKSCRTPRLFADGTVTKRCRMFGTSSACECTDFEEPSVGDHQRLIKSIAQRAIIDQEKDHRHSARVDSRGQPGVSTGLKGAPHRGPKPGPVDHKKKGGGRRQPEHASVKRVEVLPAGSTAPVVQLTAVSYMIKAQKLGANEESPQGASVSAPVIEYKYNVYGFDELGQPGPEAGDTSQDPELRRGPFNFSQNALDARGKDVAGFTPPFPTELQRAEIASLGIGEPAANSSEYEEDLVVALSAVEAVVIPMHVTAAQSDNILAVCDMERVGMVLVTAKSSRGLVSWLALSGGGGIRLQRSGGLIYLRARHDESSGIVIGDGGDLKFLIDTGAQASLASSANCGFIADMTKATTALTAAGGNAIAVSTSGALRMRYVPGKESMFNLDKVPLGQVPPMLHDWTADASSDCDDEGAAQSVSGAAAINSVRIVATCLSAGENSRDQNECERNPFPEQKCLAAPRERYVDVLRRGKGVGVSDPASKHGQRHFPLPGQRANVVIKRTYDSANDRCRAVMVFTDQETEEVFTHTLRVENCQSYGGGLHHYRNHIAIRHQRDTLTQVNFENEVAWHVSDDAMRLRHNASHSMLALAPPDRRTAASSSQRALFRSPSSTSTSSKGITATVVPIETADTYSNAVPSIALSATLAWLALGSRPEAVAAAAALFLAQRKLYPKGSNVGLWHRGLLSPVGSAANVSMVA